MNKKVNKKIISALVNFTEMTIVGYGVVESEDHYVNVLVHWTEGQSKVYVDEVGQYKPLSELIVMFWVASDKELGKDELLKMEEKQEKKEARETEKEHQRRLHELRDFLGKKRVDSECKRGYKLLEDLDLYERHPVKYLKIVKCLLENFKQIHQSPYSDSFYDSDDISWGHKPEGSLRLSDHWNFWSRGEQHCIIAESDGKYISGRWLLCRFENGAYHIVKEVA